VTSALENDLRTSSISAAAPTRRPGSPSGVLPRAIPLTNCQPRWWNWTRSAKPRLERHESGQPLPLNSFRQAAADYSAKLVWISVSRSTRDTFVRRSKRDGCLGLSGADRIVDGRTSVVLDSVSPATSLHRLLVIHCDTRRISRRFIRSKRSSDDLFLKQVWGIHAS